MKNKIFILAFAAAILFSCENNRELCPVSETKAYIEPAYSIQKTRSLEDAESWAQMSISLIEDESTKSGRVFRKIESKDVITIQGTKSNDWALDTLMYIFNFADSLGFSIIAGDSSIKPILAVTERGHYDGESSGNEAFDEYMEALKERIVYRIGGPGHELYYWYDYVMEGDSANRNVGVRWGQGDIYGAYCPNGLSGCVATAMAQIMAYHKRPSSFYASLNMGNDFLSNELVPLNWTRIIEHQVVHSDSLLCTSYHKNIGALLREIGYQVDMNYNFDPLSSSAYSSAVPDGFSYFGYNTSALVAFNVNNAKSAIKSFGPIYMSGTRTDSSGIHGHAWVVDEYKDYEYYYCKFEMAQAGSYTPIITQRTLVSEEHVFHINWGWNGDCNGFFSLGVFDVDDAESYDYSHYTSGRNYNTDLVMVVVY